MSNVVHPPSRELRRLAARIDFALGRLVAVRRRAGLGTKWEAPRHAWTLSNLVLRQAEASCLLAKTDVVLLPSAWVVTRAAMESAARALWLLEPDDPWVGEARWLALIFEGARLHERLAESDPATHEKPGASIRGFAEGVSAQLPAGVTVPGVPGIQSMLRPYGEHLVAAYHLASQYVHAAELATGQFRSGLGVDAGFGESVDDRSWATPLWLSWQAFRVTVLTLMAHEGVTMSLDMDALTTKVEEARDALFGDTQV